MKIMNGNISAQKPFWGGCITLRKGSFEKLNGVNKAVREGTSRSIALRWQTPKFRIVRPFFFLKYAFSGVLQKPHSRIGLRQILSKSLEMDVPDRVLQQFSARLMR